MPKEEKVSSSDEIKLPWFPAYMAVFEKEQTFYCSVKTSAVKTTKRQNQNTPGSRFLSVRFFKQTGFVLVSV
jgi:hypothetical protein